MEVNANSVDIADKKPMNILITENFIFMYTNSFIVKNRNGLCYCAIMKVSCMQLVILCHYQNYLSFE